MKRTNLIFAALLLSLSLAGFYGTSAQGANEVHAPAEVTPGSHEDWCAEHNVPESQCSRCDKSLIPVFKATGDWCDKHGLPKSQDLKCNPNLKIVRPPKAS